MLSLITTSPKSSGITLTDSSLRLFTFINLTVSIKSSYSPVVTVTKFTADYTSGGNSVQLKWTTTNSNLVGKIQVYRKVGNQAICFWKNVATQQLSLTDNEIIIGNNYEYLLKITPKYGNVIYSKTVKINF